MHYYSTCCHMRYPCRHERRTRSSHPSNILKNPKTTIPKHIQVGVAYAAPPRASRLTHTGWCDMMPCLPLPGSQATTSRPSQCTADGEFPTEDELLETPRAVTTRCFGNPFTAPANDVSKTRNYRERTGMKVEFGDGYQTGIH
jgi:hypothetical protein